MAIGAGKAAEIRPVARADARDEEAHRLVRRAGARSGDEGGGGRQDGEGDETTHAGFLEWGGPANLTPGAHPGNAAVRLHSGTPPRRGAVIRQ
jgi:hypothetical protein